jgi:hypothetical protein
MDCHRLRRACQGSKNLVHLRQRHPACPQLLRPLQYVLVLEKQRRRRSGTSSRLATQSRTTRLAPFRLLKAATMTHVSKTTLCTHSHMRHPLGYQDFLGARARSSNCGCSITAPRARRDRGAPAPELQSRKCPRRMGVVRVARRRPRPGARRRGRAGAGRRVRPWSALIRKAFLWESLAVLDIDQGLSCVACSAVAGLDDRGELPDWSGMAYWRRELQPASCRGLPRTGAGDSASRARRARLRRP